MKLYVRALALWTPRFPNAEAWRARAAAEPSLPPAQLLGARARGRASLLTRMITEVVAGASASAQLDLATTPLIIGSAFGEMDTTSQLLAMMSEGDGALSPARFQSSVHNAAAGLISIASANQGFSTCLAAGHATTAALLLEARAFLAEHGDRGEHGGTALVVMADEQLPDFFASNERYEPAAAALVLSTSPAGALAELGNEQRLLVSPVLGTYPELGPTPVAPLIALIDAVHARRNHVHIPTIRGALELQLRYEGA